MYLQRQVHTAQKECNKTGASLKVSLMSLIIMLNRKKMVEIQSNKY